MKMRILLQSYKPKFVVSIVIDINCYLKRNFFSNMDSNSSFMDYSKEEGSSETQEGKLFLSDDPFLLSYQNSLG
uniref:Uncharacterized protein n=1 Tax=Strongyloides venezuelensis TaxID=75913 RepID=A0A0K0FGD2_STRVS